MATSAHAEPWYVAAPSDRLALSPRADVALLSAAVSVAVVPEIFKRQLAPATCRFCNGPDNTGLAGDPLNGRGELNGVDAAAHDALTGFLLSRRGADTASNVVAYVIAPGFAFGSAALFTGDSSSGSGARSAVVVAESGGVALALVQSTKYLVARKRPFIRYGHGIAGESEGEGTVYEVTNPDSHLSFPSGHTAFVTSVTVAAAMTATIQNSRATPWLWASAATLSIGTGTLRMMAEKHYLTDVAAGAAIGAAAGVVLPLLHRANSPLGTRTSALSGPALTWSMAF